MSNTSCIYCGGKTKKFGKTKAGSQRWRCLSCKATFVRKIDNSAKLLKTFLEWLFGPKRQNDMPGAGRTFRRKCKKFWEIWPIAPITGEVYRVIFVDGIYLARNVVILIATSKDYVIGWYIARSENSKAWGALISRIPPPEVVVTDGGTGFEKARKRYWKQTEVQRCVFHVFLQVKKETTSRPKLLAGRQLYDLAKMLLKVKTQDDAIAWLGAYNEWHIIWEEFLAEQTRNEVTGKLEWTHARLVKARNGLDLLIKRGHLFTFLKPELTIDGPLPATNNKIEGGINAQLREMLRRHHGLSLLRSAKAVFWWCYMHSECPASAPEILATMPTDDDIAELYRSAAYEPQKREGSQEWGDGLVWAELRHALPWRIEWD